MPSWGLSGHTGKTGTARPSRKYAYFLGTYGKLSPGPSAREISMEHARQPPNLQHVLDAVLDGIVALSPRGDIDWLNEEACQVLETSPEAAIGQPLGDLTGRDHPILALLAKVQKSGRHVLGQTDVNSGQTISIV